MNKMMAHVRKTDARIAEERKNSAKSEVWCHDTYWMPVLGRLGEGSRKIAGAFFVKTG